MDAGKLKKLDLSYMSMANIILVASKMRPGGKIGYFETGIEDLQEVLIGCGVYFSEDKSKDGRIPVTISIDDEHFKLYIKALAMRSEDIEESIRIFGDFYGYPQCCVERYIKDLKNKLHPITRYWSQLIESKRFPDLFAIFHVPCGPDCAESKAIDESFIKKLNEIDEEIAKGYLDGKKANLAWALAIHSDYYHADKR
ncbi:MAG: hypothetical protein FJ150_08420 [Euryarchaeota archaeon]|nr:hypothetical protein [Euryarchaeota archaeon]